MLWWTLRQLKSKNAVTRTRAIRKLGQSKNRHVRESLFAVLDDEVLEVREAAAEVLREDDRNLQPLIRTLEDESWEARKFAVRKLDLLGWQPVNDAHRALWWIVNGKVSETAALGGAAVEPLSALVQQIDSEIDKTWRTWRESTVEDPPSCQGGSLPGNWRPLDRSGEGRGHVPRIASRERRLVGDSAKRRNLPR